MVTFPIFAEAGRRRGDLHRVSLHQHIAVQLTVIHISVHIVTQPELSRRILDRKVDALRAAGGANPIVASANPGCMVQLRGAGIDARHPADLIAEALDE